MKGRINKMDELFPYRKNEEGKPLCRKCGGGLSGRRTSWCSDKCVQEALIICDPNFARNHVGRRDHGVCANCCKDTEHLESLFIKWRKRIFALWGRDKAREWERRWQKKGWPGLYRSWWEADHIVPVIEGGGGCGLDNYRTLCVPCHKKETADLARRRAEQRRGQGVLQADKDRIKAKVINLTGKGEHDGITGIG